MWEMPLFRWGAVAATTVVVIGAVSLGIYDHEKRPEAFFTREAPFPATQPDKVSAPQPSDDLRRDTAIPAVSAKRAVHLQEQVRFEKPASTPTNPKAKDEKKEGAGALGGLLGVPRQGASRTDATDAYQVKVEAGSPPLATADLDKAFQTSANAPLVGRDSASLSIRTAPAVSVQKADQKNELKQAPVGSTNESVEVSSYAANVYPADEASVKSQNEVVAMNAAPVPQVGPETPTQRSVVMDKVQSNRKAALFHEVHPIESVITGTEWQITREGELQRSFSRGNFWEAMLKGRQFRSVAVVADRIWAGGDDGALYFSSDNGRNWNPMPVHDANVSVTGNIVRLRFADAQNGSLDTSSGETWNTNDGGQSWHKQ
jgi:hypothetical protein